MTIYRRVGDGYEPIMGDYTYEVDGQDYVIAAAALTLWPSKDLAAHGLYSPADAAPVPEDKVSLGLVVEDVGGVPTYAHHLRDRTLAEATEEARRLVAAHIDSVAAQEGYDSGVACAGYATSSVAKWQAEAAAFVAWRDVVWTQVFALLAAVEAGSATIPTPADLIASLPAITWPSV